MEVGEGMEYWGLGVMWGKMVRGNGVGKVFLMGLVVDGEEGGEKGGEGRRRGGCWGRGGLGGGRGKRGWGGGGFW